MKTIKIIDILVKVVNGEEVPKKFRLKNSDYKDLYFQYNEKYECYDLIGKNFKAGCWVFGYGELNEEIEIIEDSLKEDKKIAKVDVAWQNVFDEQAQQDLAKMILNTINEIIDKINGDE